MAIEGPAEDRSQSESKLDELNSSISSMSREDQRIRPDLRAPGLLRHSIGIMDRIRSDHEKESRKKSLEKSLEKERSPEGVPKKVQFKDRSVFRESHDEGSVVLEEMDDDDDAETTCPLPQDLPDEVLRGEEKLKLLWEEEDRQDAVVLEASAVTESSVVSSVDKWAVGLMVFAILFFLSAPMLMVYLLCRVKVDDAPDDVEFDC